MQKQIKCRHCSSEFIPIPGKRGFIDECPSCVADRYDLKVETIEEKPKPARECNHFSCHGSKCSKKIDLTPMTPEKHRRQMRAFDRKLREIAKLIREMAKR